MTNDGNTPRPGQDPAVGTAVEQARRDRRRRTVYASLAGWALLGAASTGIVACSSAATSEPAGAAGATTGASNAATSSSGAAVSSSPAGSAPASSAASAAPSSAAPSSAAPSSTAYGASSSEAAATTAAAAGAYKDGTYTATGTYQSPGGQESVTITLTLAGDTITAASGEGGATRPPSSQYQGEFLDNFAGQIVGKNVDQVSLSKVAGSSLTSGGFNQALQTIKSDARA